jgi:uridine kinase
MERRELLKDLAFRIAAVELPHPMRVAIDGVDAAGKTILANEVAHLIEGLGRPVICASVDGFHNPAAVRRRRGPSSPEGYFEDSFNYGALLSALLLPLGPGGPRDFRRAVFDFRTDQRGRIPDRARRAERDLALRWRLSATARPGYVNQQAVHSAYVRR